MWRFLFVFCLVIVLPKRVLLKRVISMEEASATTDINWMKSNYSLVNGALSATIEVIQDIQGFSTISKLTVVKDNEKTGTMIFNRTIDCCSIFAKENRNDWFYRMFVVAYTKYSDIPMRCPLKKGVYHLNRFRFDDEVLPSWIYVPDTRSKFTANFFTIVNKKKIFFLNTATFMRVLNK